MELLYRLTMNAPRDFAQIRLRLSTEQEFRQAIENQLKNGNEKKFRRPNISTWRPGLSPNRRTPLGIKKPPPATRVEPVSRG